MAGARSESVGLFYADGHVRVYHGSLTDLTVVAAERREFSPQGPAVEGSKLSLVTDPFYVRAARTMGSKRFHTWVSVILPASLPFLVTSMKQGWAFAWRSLMAAEIYLTILTGFGLGQLLHFGRELNPIDQVIGIMLVIVVIGLLVDKILFSPWEGFLHHRWETARGTISKC